MLDNEPLSYPSRHRYVMDPGIPNRQLWAIGMIVVQWSNIEWFIDMSTHQLVGDDKALLQEYKNLRNFKQSLAFWATLVERNTEDPYRSYMLAIIPRVQALSSQRDEVIHRLWGGGMEAESPSMWRSRLGAQAILGASSRPLSVNPISFQSA